MKISMNLSKAQVESVQEIQEAKMLDSFEEACAYVFQYGINRIETLARAARKDRKIQRALDAGKEVPKDAKRAYAPRLPVFNAERAAVKVKAGRGA